MMNDRHSTKKKAATNRRRFMQTTAAAGVLASAPMFIPGSVLGQDGTVPPSERIVMGGIGIGNRGSFDLRNFMRHPDVQFVADCDPQKSRAARVKELIDARYDNSDCKLYHNIDEYLATRTDLDGVLSTTGDRWHALAAIKAMKAGKDVYSEKPSCMTIAEGQGVVKTAHRYGRIYQTGNQRLSEELFVIANELLRLGRLGKVHTVRAHIAPWDAAIMSYDWKPEQPLPPKEEVDWDQWLGPCPWRPYNADYCKGQWRGYYDFHTSCIGEWGAHTIAQCQVAIGAGDTSGIEYKYVPNESGDGMEIKFENGITMVLERDLEKKYWHGPKKDAWYSCGVRYEGTEGWVAIADDHTQPDVSDPKLLADSKKIVDDYIERTGRPCRGPMMHIRNLLDCIKSRDKTIANEVVMHRSMTTVHAANICMWLKRDMKYDPVKEEFINDDEANRLRSRAMREPWII